MKDNTGIRNWSKESEKDYLDKLLSGKVFQGCPHVPQISKSDILRNYISSARKRMDWGTYVNDGEEIIDYAEKYLNKMEM